MKSVLKGFTHFFFYSPAAILCYIFFRLFNRLTIMGYRDYKRHSSALICANHISAFDSFAIGHIFFPKPVYFPAKEELFKNKIVAILLGIFNAFPVSRGYADQGLLEQIAGNAKKHLVLIHPEGTRQKPGELGQGKKAVGKVIYLGKTTVIPIYVRGTERILPRGSLIPRLFRKTVINIGSPVGLDDLYEKDDSRETARLIVQRVMQSISELKEETENTSK